MQQIKNEKLRQPNFLVWNRRLFPGIRKPLERSFGNDHVYNYSTQARSTIMNQLTVLREKLAKVMSNIMSI